AAQVAAPPPPEVMVAKPITQMVTDYEDFPGQTAAVYSIDIRARVQGFLNNANFQEGAEVHEGDLLFEIDPRPYEAEVARTEALVVQTQARLKRTEATYQKGQKLYELAKAKGGVSAVSDEELSIMESDRGEAQGNLDAAKAARDMALLNLSFTKVRSPISGRISRRYLDPGNLVKSDDTVLTSVVSFDPIYVNFDLDEHTTLRLQRMIREGKIRWNTEAVAPAEAIAGLVGNLPGLAEGTTPVPEFGPMLLRMAMAVRKWRHEEYWRETADLGLPVLIGLADEEGYPRDGMINFADNKVDPDTGTWRLRGRFSNKDRSLTPGLFARVRLPLGQPFEAIMISEKAIGTDQGQKFVYVVDAQNQVSYRRIQVGRMQNGLRVIRGGLSKDEKIIVTGLQRVREGVKVTPKDVDMPVPVPAPTSPNEQTVKAKK
ncbi:MAG TPA: efflux RND transporter periplasmic adaptor subunit, partial [Gemmataceae bacterium]|nr:efflux RND transporter periplasmic adaptor subunit [Gemmataceae bacterium]